MSAAATVVRLENAGGAAVLLETSRALPLVSISIGLKSGSLIDEPGKEGSTRLLSRLMRRTAGGLEPQVIDTRIDSLGASLSADVTPVVAGFTIPPACLTGSNEDTGLGALSLAGLALPGCGASTTFASSWRNPTMHLNMPGVYSGCGWKLYARHMTQCLCTSCVRERCG